LTARSSNRVATPRHCLSRFTQRSTRGPDHHRTTGQSHSHSTRPHSTEPDRTEHDHPQRPIQRAGEVVDQLEGVDLELVDMVAVHQLDRHQQNRERCHQSDDVPRMSGQEQVRSDPRLSLLLLCRHRAPRPGAPSECYAEAVQRDRFAGADPPPLAGCGCGLAAGIRGRRRRRSAGGRAPRTRRPRAGSSRLAQRPRPHRRGPACRHRQAASPATTQLSPPRVAMSLSPVVHSRDSHTNTTPRPSRGRGSPGQRGR
jgi:hypothetical protein